MGLKEWGIITISMIILTIGIIIFFDNTCTNGETIYLQRKVDSLEHRNKQLYNELNNTHK